MNRTHRLYPLALAAFLWPASSFAEDPPHPWRAEIDANMTRVFPPKVLEEIRQAEAAEKAGKVEEALEHYEHATHMEDSGTDAAVELGFAYLRAGRYVEAARELGFV